MVLPRRAIAGADDEPRLSTGQGAGPHPRRLRADLPAGGSIQILLHQSQGAPLPAAKLETLSQSSAGSGIPQQHLNGYATQQDSQSHGQQQ